MNIISRGVVEWSVVGPGVGTVSFSHRHTPNGPRSKGGEEEVESESLHIALYVAPPSSSRGLLGSSLSSSQSGNWHVYSKRKERRNVRCEQDGQTDGHGVHRERERYRYVRRTNWTVDSLLVGLGLLAWCSHPRHRKCPIAKVNPLTNSDRWCSGCCSAGGGVYG